jgi:hypothetical protein
MIPLAVVLGELRERRVRPIAQEGLEIRARPHYWMNVEGRLAR